MLKINIHLFARLREQVPLSENTLSLAEPLTAEALWEQIGAEHIGEDIRVLCAINHQHCPLDTLIQDGDEVAFFPPVTGG